MNGTAPPLRTGRSGTKSLRLFIAVDLPPSAKAGLAAAVAPYRERVAGARWTDAQSWHVTLKFLGATRPGLMEDVAGAVGSTAASVQPFRTRLTEIGVFPGRRRVRVVWAGLADPAGGFGTLAEGLNESLRPEFRPELRGFTPHLTLARISEPRSIEELPPELLSLRLPSQPWLVDRLVLYRSHLSPRGARYEALQEFRLAVHGSEPVPDVLDLERTFE